MFKKEKNIIKELSDVEIEKVFGGFSKEVDKYEAVYGQYKGEYYYFVKDSDSNTWCYGKLLKSYEKSHFIFWSKRYHEVLICERSAAFKAGKYDDGYSADLCGDDWTIYRCRY